MNAPAAVSFEAALTAALARLDMGQHAPALHELLALQAPDEDGLGRLLLARANAALRAGQLTDSVRHASEAVRLYERRAQRAELCDARIQLALCYAHLAIGRDALEESLAALSLARALGDAEREAWSLVRVGNAYGAMDNPAQARETTQQAREIAAVHGFTEIDYACLNNQAYYTLDECEQLMLEGEEPQLVVMQAMAQLLSEQALAAAQAQHHVYKEALALSNLVEALLVGKDWSRARPLIEHLDSMAQEHGFTGLQAFTVLHRALIERGCGSLTAAIGHAQRLVMSGGLPTVPRLQRRALRLLYECHKASGDTAAALSELERLMLHERIGARQSQLVQTQVMLIQREVDQAVARAEHARADAQRERERARALELEQQALREQLARSDRAAREDVLTRLSNRRHADQALPLLWARAQDQQLPLAIALIDIDHFKSVNDARGHAVGDAVLRELAELLRLRLRSADLLARWGGEEFLVALLGPPAADAQAVFERLRNAVEHHPWQQRFPGLGLSVSVGVAQRGRDVQVREVRALIQSADKALYAAKAAGRNRVSVA